MTSNIQRSENYIPLKTNSEFRAYLEENTPVHITKKWQQNNSYLYVPYNQNQPTPGFIFTLKPNQELSDKEFQTINKIANKFILEKFQKPSQSFDKSKETASSTSTQKTIEETNTSSSSSSSRANSSRLNGVFDSQIHSSFDANKQVLINLHETQYKDAINASLPTEFEQEWNNTSTLSIETNSKSSPMRFFLCFTNKKTNESIQLQELQNRYPLVWGRLEPVHERFTQNLNNRPSDSAKPSSFPSNEINSSNQQHLLKPSLNQNKPKKRGYSKEVSVQDLSKPNSSASQGPSTKLPCTRKTDDSKYSISEYDNFDLNPQFSFEQIPLPNWGSLLSVKNSSLNTNGDRELSTQLETNSSIDLFGDQTSSSQAKLDQIKSSDFDPSIFLNTEF